jgi:hypothetical protein
MTDEEKKAAEEAAKAAAKKAQEEGGDPEDAPEGKHVPREQYEALKKESIAHRRENKELKDRIAKIEQGLGLISGKAPDKAADELAAAKKDGEDRAKRSLLIAEIASTAPDAHNAKVLFRTAPELFGAVEVDLSTDSVDEDQLDAALKAARKKHPYLFKGEAAPAPAKDPKAPGGAAPPKVQGTLPRVGAPAPDGSGSPGADGSLREQYQALMDAGKVGEAQKFYKENRAGIMAELKAAGKR